jgi:hypothetical protein
VYLSLLGTLGFGVFTFVVKSSTEIDSKKIIELNESNNLTSIPYKLRWCLNIPQTNGRT